MTPNNNSVPQSHTDMANVAAIFLKYGAIELRRPKAGGGAISGVFDDANKLAEKAQSQDGLGNIYITLNPVASAVNNRLERVSDTTNDAAVTRRRWLLVDVDPTRPSGTSATDSEKAAALGVLHAVMDYLRSRGFSEPAEADSGNGGHALYPIDLPNDEASKMLVKDVLGALAAMFDTAQASVDTSVYNAARITKLYGTLAVKGEDTPERPHRRSRLVSVPEALEPVPVGLMQAVAALRPPQQQGSAQREQGQPGEPKVKRVHDPAKYAADALEGACKAIRGAGEQSSHNTTLHHARLVGGLVAGGYLDETEVRGRLVDAAVARKVDNAATVVEDGLRHGMLDPIKLEALAKKTAEEKAQDFLQTIQDHISFFRDQNGEVQAEWPGSGASPINRAAVNQKIARVAYEEHKTLVSPDTVKLINNTLAAITDDTRYRLGVRVHQPDKRRLYVDLGDGRAVDITPEGWSIVPLPAKSFRRYSRQTPLPMPDTAGTVADFHALLDLVRATDNDRLLLKCWLVTCLFPDIAHAILSINGPKGTAKTTTASLLRSLIDPGSDSLMTNPHDITAYAVSAEKRWVMGFDNLSHMPQWLSDGLCMSSTGGTVSKRQLYTDADEVMLDLRRVVIMTSIPQVGEREDLLDRMLMMPLTEISDDERMTEEEWNSKVVALLPKALGGLYSVTAAVLASTSPRPAKLPRLADWALIAGRAAEALGHSQEEFFAAWQRVTDRQTSEAADASPLVDLLETLLVTKHGEWSGRMSDLLSALREEGITHNINMNGKAWPQSPRMLSVKLAEQTTSLRVHGIDVSCRTLNGRARYTLRLPAHLEQQRQAG